MRRVLDWAACWNVRDLGGYATRSGETTKYGRVVRAGNLSKLTQSGKHALVAYGVRTVIDLRDPREFAIDLNPFQEQGQWRGEVRYLSVPLISEQGWEALRDPELRKRGYALLVEIDGPSIARVLNAIVEAESGAVVLHCHAGKERTGVIAALLLELVGVPDETIAEDFVASDEHLQTLYEEWSRREEDPVRREQLLASFRSEASHIAAPLEYVRAAGGIDAYLLRSGVSVENLSVMRSRLLDPTPTSRAARLVL